MTISNVGNAIRTYETLSRLRRERHVTYFPRLYRFSRAISDIEREFREISADDLWSAWLREVKRLRYWFAAVPLPTNHPALCPVPSIEQLRSHVLRLERSYPAVAAKALTVIDALEDLLLKGESPLLTVTSQLLQGSSSAVLVIGVSKMIPHVQEELRNRGLYGVDVITPDGLRGSRWYDQQVVVATPSLQRTYPHVYSVPKAILLRVVHVAWVNPASLPAPAFPHSLHRSCTPTEVVYVHNAPQAADVDKIEPLPDTLDFDVTFDDVVRVSGRGTDDVPAVALLLETDEVIFYEKGSRTLVIDLASPSGIPVRWMLADNIQPGMFVLIRTDRSGDYVEEVANRILGPTITSLARSAQKDWKQRLRAQVAEKGAAQVAAELRAYGCTRASDTNVRNWISPQSIATQAFRDFEAIMSYIGHQGLAKAYWQLMKRLRRAHVKAGQTIRKELVSLVTTSVDYEKLLTYGKQDFELRTERTQGVRLTALRVRRVIEGEHSTNPYRLGQPLTI
ncbi:MAG TPA: hypothetical protein VKZ59_05495 [Acidobacteriota bacterium]|nr:hypothetical protein [Acidobacteriota bacterium]